MNKEQKSIIDIISQQTDPPVPAKSITSSHSIEELGLDSLKFMLTIIEIEHQLGKSIFNVEVMPNIKTVGDVLDLVN